MIYTIIVISFDETFSIERMDDLGVPPSVYLIPADKIADVKKCADDAHDIFHEKVQEPWDCAIGNIFEEQLEEAGIPFQYLNDLNILFEYRQEEYLADYIPLVEI